MKIAGKTIWITGASSGIGEAIARLAVRSGARVILSARNTAKLNTLKMELDAIAPACSTVVTLDVTSRPSIEEALMTVQRNFKQVDVLVNNAGVSQRSWAIETPVEIDRLIMETNFFGSVAITKGILPLMVNQGGGHLVVISSMTGLYGFPMRSAYAAAKHALRGFFETLGLELRNKHIRVTLVYPGRVRTDVSINSLDKDGNKYGIMDPGQARGVPVEVCARRILRAVERNKPEVLMGTGETFLYYMRKFIPPIFYLIARKTSPT